MKASGQTESDSGQPSRSKASPKGLATASMICSIAGLFLLLVAFCCGSGLTAVSAFLGAPFAILMLVVCMAIAATGLIIGIVALKKMKAAGNEAGKGMAIAGVVIGGAGTALSFALVLLGLLAVFGLVSLGAAVQLFGR